jgi:hypothetical protein
MQSKAIEGVPRRAHAFSCTAHALDISPSIFLRLCWSSHSFFFLSRSAHVDLIYTDYFTIAIDHPRG